MNSSDHPVKRFRKFLEVDQTEFGKMFGIAQSHVSAIENSQRRAPCEVVLAIFAFSPEKIDISELTPSLQETMNKIAIRAVKNKALPTNRV